MRKNLVLLSLITFIVMSALSITTLALTQANSAGREKMATSQVGNNDLAATGTDSNPTGTPEVVIPEQYRPTATDAPTALAAQLATVYFTPQDENTSTTILFLYNTNPATATVGLQTFYINGALTISTTVAVPPLGLVRVSADSVNTVSASWANYVLVNFTTFSAYAKMTLPQGVKAEGYVAWDTTGIYDPLTSTQTLPLRFSTDPLNVFLPTVNRR